MKSLTSELLSYGIPSNSIVEFGATPTAREVRYLDLFESSGETLPSGVIESAARPTVYVKVNNSLGAQPFTTTDLQDLIRTLACRADARFLADIDPGTVTVYKVGFFDASEENRYLFQDTPEASGFAT